MTVDLEQLGATREPIRAQVCVVGAGIAGLVLAQRLAARGVSVALLEAGGAELEERSQNIYNAAVVGRLHDGTRTGRFRALGGSSTRWGGQLLPYTAEIFQPGAALPSRAWPITGEELAPYMREAEKIFGADDLPYEGKEFLAAMRAGVARELIATDEMRLRFSKWAPFSQRNLANTVAKELGSHPLVTIYLHANLKELLLREDGARVAAALVRNYAGAEFRFEAEHFVLAAGTIESARLLLASRSVMACGVGNAQDQVGRYFHDHPSVVAAPLTGDARKNLLRAFAPFQVGGTGHTAKLEASPKLRVRLKMLAVMAHLTVEEPEDSGAGVARALLTALQVGNLREAFGRELPKLPGASMELVKLAFAAKVRRRRYVSPRAAVTLRINCEQKPSAETRVRLHESAVDALGMPQAVVDWRVSDEEVATLRAYAGWLRGYLEAAKVGPVVFQPELFDQTVELTGITDTYHPMGGARMGTDPRESVVDAELTVHGLENLSVASAAVYPAGGSSNPTLTLMCLAMRLGDRLATKFSA